MSSQVTSHLRRWLAAAVVAGAFALPASPAIAQSVVIDPVLVERGNVTIRKSDFDAEMRRIPEKDRAEFLSSARRVRELIDRMLMTLELAEAAKAKGVGKDPLVARRIELEQDKILAEVYLNDVEAAAGREFDAKLPRIEPAVREVYLASKAKYSKPDSVMVTELTFSFDGSPDAAKARADEAWAKIRGGADIGDLAAADKRSPASMRRGIRGPLARTDLDPEVAAVVFGAAKVGEVNAPVRSADKWTIVRVNERIPASTQSYEEVRYSIVKVMREEYMRHARDAEIAALGAGKTVVVNEPAIETMRTSAGAKN
jgi:parvulin-like peptidyl-prolyl isomerase